MFLLNHNEVHYFNPWKTSLNGTLPALASYIKWQQVPAAIIINNYKQYLNFLSVAKNK